MLDTCDKITFCNWPVHRQLKCETNNDLSIPIPTYLYVLLSRSILYHCEMNQLITFSLESLAAFTGNASDFIMYFIVNIAFVNYINDMPDIITNNSI